MSTFLERARAQAEGQAMKPETEIRNLKRAMNELKRENTAERDARRALLIERDEARGRLNRANEEIADWKKRFDLLLSKLREEASDD